MTPIRRTSTSTFLNDWLGVRRSDDVLDSLDHTYCPREHHDKDDFNLYLSAFCVRSSDTPTQTLDPLSLLTKKGTCPTTTHIGRNHNEEAAKSKHSAVVGTALSSGWRDHSRCFRLSSMQSCFRFMQGSVQSAIIISS